jgi:hypothetical protein
MREMAFDIKLTEDGDFEIAPNGDLAVVTDNDLLAQYVRCVLENVSVDWFYDNIGADLEDYLGEPNTRDTADAAAAQIQTALLKGGLISANDILIQPVPISKTEIRFFVFINTGNPQLPMGFDVSLKLGAGVAVQRIQ